MVAGYQGRAVCLAAGGPSGLSATLPPVLAQPRQVLGAEATIMPGLDRGGSYPVAFRAIREQRADWVTWRRGPLAQVTAAPRRHWAAPGDGRPAEVLTLADESAEIKDNGEARQITLSEDGVPVLQVLTSDTTAPAVALLAWLCDYHASPEDDDHLTATPTQGRPRPAAPGRGGPGRRRAGARRRDLRPGPFRRRQEQGRPGRREQDHQGQGRRHRGEGGAQAHPR